jgi:hypothetical protein
MWRKPVRNKKNHKGSASVKIIQVLSNNHGKGCLHFSITLPPFEGNNNNDFILLDAQPFTTSLGFFVLHIYFLPASSFVEPL